VLVKESPPDCDLDTVLVQSEAAGTGVCHQAIRRFFFRPSRTTGGWEVSEERAYDPASVYGN